jgi:hypothetical protein
MVGFQAEPGWQNTSKPQASSTIFRLVVGLGVRSQVELFGGIGAGSAGVTEVGLSFHVCIRGAPLIAIGTFSSGVFVKLNNSCCLHHYRST